MANYQHLPLPDSFPDFSCYSQAFDEFAALDYNQDVIYEYQPVTPENQLTKATPSVVGNQIDKPQTPESGASNDVSDSPKIDPQNDTAYLPSPEYFNQSMIDLCGQQSTEIPLGISQGTTFTFNHQGSPAAPHQRAQFFYGNQGYFQHGTMEGRKAGNYKDQIYNAGVANIGSTTNGLGLQQTAALHYHSAALKVESSEGNEITAQAPLNDGSPHRSTRRPGSRAKANAKIIYAEHNEEDADDSDDDDYVDEADNSKTDLRETGDSTQAFRKFTPQIKNIDEYRAILIAEEEKLQKLAVKSEGSRGSFPTDSAGQQACVAEILAAIHNFEGIVDKAGKNGKAAQSHNRFEKGFYQQQEIELKAWQLLLRIRDVNNGNRLIAKHIEEKHEVYENFRERFDRVVQGLKQSKAMCKMMMDPAYIDRLAQAPSGEFRTKINNKKINGQRDVDNQRGRLAKKLGLDIEIEKAVLKQTGSESPASVPQTPSKKSAVTAATPSSRKRKNRSMDEVEGGDPFSGSPGSGKKPRATPRKPAAAINSPATPHTPNALQMSPLNAYTPLSAYTPLNFGRGGLQGSVMFPELAMPTSNKIPEITPGRLPNMSLAGTPPRIPYLFQRTAAEDKAA